LQSEKGCGEIQGMVLKCPICGKEGFETRYSLGGHMILKHMMDGKEAQAKAKEIWLKEKEAEAEAQGLKC
jgi:hypothetical protein